MLVSELTFGKPNVNTRIQNLFGQQGIVTLDQLAQHSTGELLDIRSFGLGCLEAVMTALKPHGIVLRQEL